MRFNNDDQDQAFDRMRDDKLTDAADAEKVCKHCKQRLATVGEMVNGEHALCAEIGRWGKQ